MNTKRPFFTTFIGYFYIFGSIVLLLSLGTKQSVPFNIRFGLPNAPETLVRILIATFSLIMATLYLRETKIGYYLMVIYSILFILINLIQISNVDIQPFIGNVRFATVTLIYTIIKRHNFNNNLKYIKRSC